MAIRYSQEFKEQAIEKTLQRGDKTIQCIDLFTLKVSFEDRQVYLGIMPGDNNALFQG